MAKQRPVLGEEEIKSIIKEGVAKAQEEMELDERIDELAADLETDTLYCGGCDRPSPECVCAGLDLSPPEIWLDPSAHR